MPRDWSKGQQAGRDRFVSGDVSSGDVVIAGAAESEVDVVLHSLREKSAGLHDSMTVPFTANEARYVADVLSRSAVSPQSPAAFTPLFAVVRHAWWLGFGTGFIGGGLVALAARTLLS